MKMYKSLVHAVNVALSGIVGSILPLFTYKY